MRNTATSLCTETQTEGQGEIDVIGFQVEPRKVWLCEVATHLDGLLYGSGGNAGTLAKVRQKVKRAVAFGDQTFPDQERRFEWWSPKASPALMSGFDEIISEMSAVDTQIAFIVNGSYAERVCSLLERSKQGTKATPEIFFRALQILTHLSGSPVQWD